MGLLISPYSNLFANITPACRPQGKISLYTFVKYSVFAHPFANRNQLEDQDGLSLSPKNAVRQLGVSDEAEPQGVELAYQRQGTDKASTQECGYAKLTPRTMMVNQIKLQLINLCYRSRELWITKPRCRR